MDAESVPSPPTIIQEITLSSDSESDDNDDIGIERIDLSDSDDEIEETPPLPSSIPSTSRPQQSPQSIESRIGDQLDEPTSPIIVVVQSPGVQFQQASSSSSPSLSSSLANLSFLELQTRVAQLEESAKQTQEKLKVSLAENAELKTAYRQAKLIQSAKQQNAVETEAKLRAATEAIKALTLTSSELKSKLAAQTELLKEKEEKRKKLEIESKAKIEGLRGRLKEFYNHLSSLLGLSEIQAGEVANMALREETTFEEMADMITNMEKEWDAGIVEAAEDTRKLQEEVAKTNGMVYDIVKLLNEDEDEDEGENVDDPEASASPPSTPERMDEDNE